MSKSIVFIDIRVADYQTLLAGLPADVETILIDGSRDGLQQMADAVTGRSGIDAIHVFSHGSAGTLQLGRATLNNDTLNSYAPLLAQIGQSLAAEGDLLLYGCNVGAGETGQAFVESIARITQADVAASDDLTGAADQGGDWVLEKVSGNIEVNPLAITGYATTLAPSGSPVFDFEGPTDDTGAEVTFANSTGHTLSVSVDSGGVDVWTNDTSYVVAQTGNAGKIHIRFTDGATFDATSVSFKNLMFGMIQVNAMITSNLTDRNSLSYSTSDANNDELYVWNTDITDSFSSVDLSMFQGVTDLYIEDFSGGQIQVAIDDFTVDFPASNASPVIAYLDGDSVSTTIDQSVVIDTNQMPNPALITDADSANFHGGYLQIHQNSGDAGDFSAISFAVLFGASGVDGNGDPVSASGTPATEDAVYVFTVAGWVNIGTVDIGQMGSDGQNGNDLEIALNANATPDYTSILLQTLQYSAATPGIREFQAKVSDGSDWSAPAIFTVEITGGSNAVPVITNLNGDSQSFTGFNYLDVDQDATVSDTEFDALNNGDGNWAGATLTIRRAGGAISSDVLSLNPNGVTVKVDEINSTLTDGDDLVFASYTNANGVFAITFNSTGTPATTEYVQHILQSFAYEGTGAHSGDAIFEFVLSNGTSDATATSTVKYHKIYVTNNTDTDTIDRTDGVSFREAFAIAAAQTSSATEEVILQSGVTSPLTISGTTTLNGDLIVDANFSSGETLTGGGIDTDTHTLTFKNGSADTYTIDVELSGEAAGAIKLSSTGGTDNNSISYAVLSQTNTGHAGKTIVDMATNGNDLGFLQIAGDNNLTSGTLQFISGGLKITGAGNNSINNAISFAGTTSLYLAAGSTTEFYEGGMSGNGSFQINGDGGVANAIFSSSNTNNGGVSVSTDAILTLQDSASNAIKDTATLTIASGGKVLLNQDTETIARLQVYGSDSILDLNSRVMTVSGEGNGNSTFYGALQGSDTDSKLYIQDIDSETIPSVFTVNSTQAAMTDFAGRTYVDNGGKLLINSGAYMGGNRLTIGDGSAGLLQGNGTSLGFVKVEANGTVGAGLADYTASVGRLTFNNGLLATTGSTLHFNINNTVAGTSYDQLRVTGGVELDNTTLKTTGTYAGGAHEFVLIDNVSNDAVTGTFNGLAEGATVTVNGVAMTLSYQGGDGNDVTLTASAGNTAPENTISALYSTNEDTKLTIDDLAVADDEGDTLTVTLSVNHGVLNLPTINTATGITALDSDGLDGSIRFSGSAADINTMLEDGVDFYPIANANGNAAATLTMTTSDGTGTDIDTAAINVTAVNDTPTFKQGGAYWLSDWYVGYEAYASVLQPDGKLVTVGWANDEPDLSGDINSLVLVRLNADGTPDESFGSFGERSYQGYLGGDSVALQPDGMIVVAGWDEYYNVYLARFNADGSTDNGFGFIDVTDDTELDDLYVEKVLIQADGKIVLVGGQNPDDGDGGDVVLVRYDLEGDLDTTFGNGAGYVVQDLGSTDGAFDAAIDASGNIVIAGAVGDDMALARFDSSGNLDTSFDTDGIATLSFGNDSVSKADAIAIQSDGKIVVAGVTDETTGGDDDIALARFDTDGSLDTNFGTNGTAVLTQIHDVLGDLTLAPDNGDDAVNSIALDASGNIYVGGQFNYNGPNADDDTVNADFQALAKFTSSGALDTNFGTNGIALPGSVEYGYLDEGEVAYTGSVLVQPDGQVVMAGGDKYYDGYDDEFYNDWWAQRVDSQGNIDTEFNANRDTVYYARTYSYEEESETPVTIGGRGNPPVVFDVEQHAADDYAGGTLTIHRVGGANAEDLLFFDIFNQGSPFILNGLTYGTTGNGTPVIYDSSHRIFATYDVSTPGQLVVHFNSEQTAATQTFVDAITASILYLNANTINPGFDAGRVEMEWTYNDGDGESTTSTCRIPIVGVDDGGIEGTVTVSGTPTTGTTLTISGLETVTDPDLVTDDNPEGTVPEDDLSYQWQVYDTDTEEWIDIDGATEASFEITADENGKQVRVKVGYEDEISGDFTELNSSAASSGGGSGGGGGSSGNGNGSGTPLPPPSPSTPTGTYDGVTIGATTETTASGSTITTVTVPVVSDTRVDDPGTVHNTHADIPLARDAGGATVIQVSVPTGVGLSAQTISGSSNGARLTLREILVAASDPKVPNTEVFQEVLQRGIDTYVPSVADEQQVTVRSITLTVAPGATQAPGAPIIITGASGTGESDTANPDRQEALVIDARALPSGSVLQLDNVEFAIVVGATKVIGGSGRNFAVGDDSRQFIVLGAEDDVLRGGGGDDTVASKGGNDKLYGDEGNDHIVGGTGNDLLEGGEGDDILQGGASDAGTWEVVRNAQGQTHLRYTATESDLTDTPAVFEPSAYAHRLDSVPLADGRAAFLHTDMAKAETIALLYQAVLGRLPNNAEINHWTAQDLDYQRMGEIAWEAYAGEATRDTLESQVRNLIEQVWGSADAETIQAGIRYIEAGGSWAEGLLWLARHDNLKTKLTDGQGLVSIMQPLTLGETGWSADAGDDQIFGGAGNDLLIGSSGNNLLDGGEGIDLVVLPGNVAHDYRVGLQETAPGVVDLVIRNALTGETNILRDVEFGKVGGVFYGPKLAGAPELKLGEFQLLADFVEVVGVAQMQEMGVPTSWL